MVKSAPMLLRRQTPPLAQSSELRRSDTKADPCTGLRIAMFAFSALFLMAEQGQEELD